MRPVLFDLAGWGVPSHEFFIALGVLVATIVFFLQVRRRGPVTEEHIWIAAGALLGGVVFAHLSAVVRFADRADSIVDLWLYGGRVPATYSLPRSLSVSPSDESAACSPSK